MSGSANTDRKLRRVVILPRLKLESTALVLALADFGNFNRTHSLNINPLGAEGK